MRGDWRPARTGICIGPVTQMQQHYMLTNDQPKLRQNSQNENSI